MTKLKKSGFLNSLGVVIYVVIVSSVLQNGDKLFGQMSNYVGPIAFLLLFCLSALVVGSLVLGKPIILYVDGKKKEAISLFLNTAYWLAGFTLLVLIIAVIIR